jgi:hypothetical protein
MLSLAYPLVVRFGTNNRGLCFDYICRWTDNGSQLDITVAGVPTALAFTTTERALLLEELGKAPAPLLQYATDKGIALDKVAYWTDNGTALSLTFVGIPDAVTFLTAERDTLLPVLQRHGWAR